MPQNPSQDNLVAETASPLMGGIPRRWVFCLVLLMVFPLFYTAPYVLLEPEQPTAIIPFPDSLTSDREGYLLVILDGVGEDIMYDDKLMPELVSRMENSAVLPVTTGPLTLSATCVREMMTGVPNAPIDGLKNFNMGHPGGADPWLLAAEDERYSVGMVGSYVMGNMYGGKDGVEFVDTFKGHADYYEGDIETGDVLETWLNTGKHDVIAAHFSGPDKVGHKWGILSEEYEDKMKDIDQQVGRLLGLVPSNWTVIVTADHGMTPSGSHGSAEADTRNVLAVITGPDVAVGAPQDNSAQLDLAAMMLYDLGLAFPSQVNGRVPLDVFNTPPAEKEIVSQWNWEARLARHLHFHPGDKDNLDVETVDWASVEAEPVVIRGLDVLLSVVVMSAFLGFGSMSLKGKEPFQRAEKQHLVLLAFVVASSMLFHANLSFSAMIPRAFGAAAVVWLVATSLGRQENLGRAQLTKPQNTKWWFAGLGALLLIFGDVSQAVLVLLLAWVVVWSGGALTGASTPHPERSTKVYLLAVMVALSIGSLRLWYALIPFYMVLTGLLFSKQQRRFSRQERSALWVIWGLVLLSLCYVHRRIFGTHHLLKLVNMGPSSVGAVVVILCLLVLCAVVFGRLIGFENPNTYSAGAAVVLIAAFLASQVDLVYAQWAVILTVLSLYVGGWYLRQEQPVRSKLMLHAALASHVMVSWGPWAAVSSLCLLMCLPALVKSLRLDSGPNLSLLQQPRAVVALAVLPWVVWILWWTLMGQVNGVQLCYEGICPHPRELDPGAVRVQGGYFGGGEQPPTLWMFFMVTSPLLAVSVAFMRTLLGSDVSLSYYIVGQGVVVFGCLALYAYTPIYPRLVFSLTWNIFFALVQILFAGLAMALHRYEAFREITGGASGKKTEQPITVLG